MLQILYSLKNIIEKYIVNLTPLRAAVSAGSTEIPLPSTRRFEYGDAVVIWNRANASEQPQGEVHCVVGQRDNRTLIIDTPLVASYPLENSYCEKMIGFNNGSETFLDAVYIGDPDVILRYPAITVDGRSRSSSWLTLESTQEDYEIDITVYVLAADYESQKELMFAYVKAIESSLFRSLYPLVQPYDCATIQTAVAASDSIIHIDDEDFMACGLSWIFLESYDYLRHNSISNDLGQGRFQLRFPVGASFEVGDKVIRPRRHIFNALPKGTEYGFVNKGTMLKAAKISYTCSEEVRRYMPYIDPLTF